MEVSIQEAYAEACRVIGEHIVTQRLLARERPATQVGPQCVECEQVFPDHADGCTKAP